MSVRLTNQSVSLKRDREGDTLTAGPVLRQFQQADRQVAWLQIQKQLIRTDTVYFSLHYIRKMYKRILVEYS